jgi:catechol 2,3-dioxygenase
MNDAAVRAGAYLHHICIQSPHPKELAGFYAQAMDMEVEAMKQDTFLCRGPSRLLLVSGGDKGRLGFAGFACRDDWSLKLYRDQIESCGIRVGAGTTPLFDGDAFSVEDPDGNTICFGLSKDGPVPKGTIRGPLQHLTLASERIEKIDAFYRERLGFLASDHVVDKDGRLMTTFLRSNHEHHTLACFRSPRQGVDHHSYEAGEWVTIRDWADHFASLGIKVKWGPGRHGPGNNLFIFIQDPDENWIEVSAELEVIQDRALAAWPHEPRTLNLWGEARMRA